MEQNLLPNMAAALSWRRGSRKRALVWRFIIARRIDGTGTG
jgi:hypothetical protein